MWPASIENFVVLMLENHSYDNLLGAVTGEIDGTQTQPLDCTDPSVRLPVTTDAPALTPLSPGHAIANVNRQLFCDEFPASDAVPSMQGFVTDYLTVMASSSEQPTPPPDQTDPIRCFGSASPVQPAALWTLAANFTVFNRWFSSVPGPTTPNRLFANCASSGGYAGDLYCATTLPQSLAGTPSIFGRLTNQGISWSCYHEDEYFVTESVLQDVADNPENCVYDCNFEKFADAIQAGELPKYCFLTPSLWTNSQHPPAPIGPGDQLIACIYKLLFTSSYANRVALLITYDEHGGYYDHVPPPSNQPYDGPQWNSSAPADFMFEKPSFDFSRWGVRVPTVLVSAYTPSSVEDQNYEHSSIVHSVRDLFGITDPLSLRDQNSTSLSTLTFLDKPRADVGSFLDAYPAG